MKMKMGEETIKDLPAFKKIPGTNSAVGCDMGDR
jgi:hypothetical protein